MEYDENYDDDEDDKAPPSTHATAAVSRPPIAAAVGQPVTTITTRTTTVCNDDSCGTMEPPPPVTVIAKTATWTIEKIAQPEPPPINNDSGSSVLPVLARALPGEDGPIIKFSEFSKWRMGQSEQDTASTATSTSDEIITDDEDGDDEVQVEATTEPQEVAEATTQEFLATFTADAVEEPDPFAALDSVEPPPPKRPRTGMPLNSDDWEKRVIWDTHDDDEEEDEDAALDSSED